jgi:hypothetical protein
MLPPPPPPSVPPPEVRPLLCLVNRLLHHLVIQIEFAILYTLDRASTFEDVKKEEIPKPNIQE